jgi:N-formylglutamate deformylase
VSNAHPAYTITRPAGAPRLVFDSPHSGRTYPPSFASIAPSGQLRWAEDAFVDELIAPATAHGAVLLCASLPRSYIDLNRTATDIDAELLSEPWPTPLTPTEKTTRGLGLVRRFVVPGVPIYALHSLSVRDVQARIREVYAPYHAALDALIAEVRNARGAVWHVNWHSMKSKGNAMTPDGAGAARADFVVSDRDGASAAPVLTSLIVDSLTAMGYRVSVNTPYKGGHIVQRLGRPADGVHSVQIEINRALYLDERNVECTAGYDTLREHLAQLAQRLVEAAP